MTDNEKKIDSLERMLTTTLRDVSEAFIPDTAIESAAPARLTRDELRKGWVVKLTTEPDISLFSPELVKRREEILDKACREVVRLEKLTARAACKRAYEAERRIEELQTQLDSAATLLREYFRFHDDVLLADDYDDTGLGTAIWLKVYDAEHPNAVKKKAAELREGIRRGASQITRERLERKEQGDG